MKKTSRRGVRLLIIIASAIALLGLGAYFLYFDPIFADEVGTDGATDSATVINNLKSKISNLYIKMEDNYKEAMEVISQAENNLQLNSDTELKIFDNLSDYYYSASKEDWTARLSEYKGAVGSSYINKLENLHEEFVELRAEEQSVVSQLRTAIETRKDADIQGTNINSDDVVRGAGEVQANFINTVADNTDASREEVERKWDSGIEALTKDGKDLTLIGLVDLAGTIDDKGTYHKLSDALGVSTADISNKTDAQMLEELKIFAGIEPDNQDNINLAMAAQKLIDYWESIQALKEIANLKSSVPHYGEKGAVIDQLTGRVQFRSPILVEVKDSSGDLVKDSNGNVRKKEIGYALFDPVKKTYSGVLTVDDFNGQRISLVADQLTKDIYVEYGGTDNQTIVGDGKLGLVSVRVGENGGIGGSFTVSNRLFIYNPNTKAFQIPISLDSTVKGAGFSGDDVGSIGKSTIFLGTDGSVTGRVGDVGKFKDGDIAGSGALYLAQDGTVTYGMSFTDGGLPLGGISINSDGDIAGTVNLAKMVDLPLNISFGSGGITGVSFDVGGGATKIPISIGKNGQLAFSLATFNIGSLIPGLNLPGILSNLLNVPILNVAQDAHGNFRLYFLFGSMKLFGHENRPLTPPEIEMDEEGNYKTECIYFRHSFKKALMTVRVYQSPCTKIEADEQKLRSAMIFEVYNRLLGRNPSTQEWANWYFYSGHQLYQWPKHEKDKQYRMDGTKLQLEKAIMGTAYYKGINSANKLDNLKEYRWIKAGKNPLQAPTRPTDLMTADPFAGKTDGGNGVDEVDKERIAKWISEGFDKFFKGIEADAATDEEMEEPTEDEISVNVPTGFSFFAVPSSIAYIDPKSFTDKGVSVYRYDGDDKKWITDANGGDVGTMRSVFGYYLYNSGAEKTVIAYKPENVENQSLSTITKGWNLLANSSQGSITVGSVKFLNPTDSTKVSLISLAQQKKIYSGTYLISDPNAQTAEKAFTKIDLLSSGAENNLIQSLGGYWVYLF